MAHTDKVRSIVSRALAEAGDEETFANSDSLIVSGRLASMDVVNIVTAIEESFGFELGADDFDPILFDTVDSIVELLERILPR